MSIIIIREMQLKTLRIAFHTNQNDWNLKKTDISVVGEDIEWLELSHIADKSE